MSLVLRLRGGGTSEPDFLEKIFLSDLKKKEKKVSKKGSIVGRNLFPGIQFCGRCLNEECSLSRSLSTRVSKHFHGTWNPISKIMAKSAFCQKCKQLLDVDSLSFFRCQARLVGKRASDVSLFSQHIQVDGQEYYKFSSSQPSYMNPNKIKWDFLNVFVTEDQTLDIPPCPVVEEQQKKQVYLGKREERDEE